MYLTDELALVLAPILEQVSQANDNEGVSDLLLRMSVLLFKNDRKEYIAEDFDESKNVCIGESGDLEVS